METEKNWLLNAELSDGQAPWEAWPADQAVPEPVEARGHPAARLERECGPGERVVWFQCVTGVPTRRQVALSARVRVAEGEAQLWVRCRDQEGTEINGYHQWAVPQATAAEGWQELTFQFPVPPEAASVDVGGAVPQQGVAWFRDFSLRLVPDDPERLRATLVETLVRQGRIPSAACRRAFLRVRRHLFVPGSALAEAYADIAIPTHCPDAEGRGPTSSSSQPSIMATMLGQLRLRRGLRVLEIGAGTGYNAALLAELVGARKVVSVDLDEVIVAEARGHLDAAGYRDAFVETADGWNGYPARAPYDRIILTVGIHDLAPAWVEQLRDGGILVAPFSFGCAQFCAAFRKRRDQLVSERISYGYFMDLRGKQPRNLIRKHGNQMCVTHDDLGEATLGLLDQILDRPDEPFSTPELLEVSRSGRFVDFWTFVALSHPLALQVSDPRIAALGIEGAAYAIADPKRGQLATMTTCFGGPEIGSELLALARRWLELGRPGLDRLSITASPHAGYSQAAQPPRDTARGRQDLSGLIEKEHTSFTWCYSPSGKEA